MEDVAKYEIESSIPQWAVDDRWWGSALMILTEMSERDKAFTDLILKYFDFEKREIHWQSIFDVSVNWSSGEKTLIELAAHLFNGFHELHSGLNGLDRLDTEWTDLALRAIQHRYGKE